MGSSNERRRTRPLVALVVGATILIGAGCARDNPGPGAAGSAPGSGRPGGSAGPDATATPARTTPAAVTERQVRIQDPDLGTLTFDALAAGDPARAGDGRLVLLLHGFPETDESYRAFLPALADAGYYAVAPNQRGYSPGARPDGVDAYAIDHLTSDTLALATALGADRFQLVGHDWGGGVAWATARAAPDRVATLTVLSTPHLDAMRDAYLDPNGEQSRMSGYMQTFRTPGVENGILANGADSFVRVFAAGGGLPEREARRYAEVLGTPAALGAALNWYRANPLPAPTALGPITVPTLFVWGREDAALGGTAARATGRYVTGAYRFEVLEGRSHWLPEEAAADVVPLLLAHLADPDHR